MEHDIRNLFNANDNYPEKEIPKNHRKEFLEKLQKVAVKKRKIKPFFFLKIVASIILIFCCTYFYLNDFSWDGKTAKTDIQIQMEAFEKEYLTNIDNEWNSFITIANDSILIKKYKIKLKEFDVNYKEISNQFNENPNNIYVLEALIESLQRCLQLVKDIKEHIKELNQKNTSNETIYL